MSMPQVNLGSSQVGQMGYGLMQLTWNPQPPSQEASFEAMKAAVDNGCTAWSTALFYGNFVGGHPEKMLDNIRLIGAFFEKYPQYKDKVTLIVKGGITPEFKNSIDLDHWRKQLKEAQEILGDKKMDIVSQSRIPEGVDPVDVAKTLKTLKEEGWCNEVGASEVNAKTLKTMNEIVPIKVVEIEISLWSYDQTIQDVIAYTSSSNIAVLAYSPLGRGFISRTYKSPDDIPEGNFIKTIPRFQGDLFYENLKLVDQLDELAAKKGIKTTQMALSWLVHLGRHVIPIPGSSNPGRVAENAQSANVKLTDDDLEGINDTLSKFEVKGDRYHGQAAVLMQ